MYPVAYRAEFEPDRNRLTTFFRLILAIPQFIWLYIYGIAFFFALVIAWFAVVLTGRYPAGLYRFNANYIRWSVRMQAYVYLVTDAYPPFSGSPEKPYPVTVEIGPPLPKYSRAKAFFRLILGIPVFVLRYVFGLLLEVVAVAAWFVIVITGRQLPGIHTALTLGMAYNTRSDAYLALLTETYPPFTEPGELDAPRSSGALPQPPAPEAIPGATGATPVPGEAPPA
jgi:hypothetical protein